MKNYFYAIELRTIEEEICEKILFDIQAALDKVSVDIDAKDILMAVEAGKNSTKNKDDVIIKIKSRYFASKFAATEEAITITNDLQAKLTDWLGRDFPILSAANPIIDNEPEALKLDEESQRFWSKDRLGFFGIFNEETEEYLVRFSVFEYTDELTYSVDGNQYSVNEFFQSSAIH